MHHLATVNIGIQTLCSAHDHIIGTNCAEESILRELQLVIREQYVSIVKCSKRSLIRVDEEFRAI